MNNLKWIKELVAMLLVAVIVSAAIAACGTNESASEEDIAKASELIDKCSRVDIMYGYDADTQKVGDVWFYVADMPERDDVVFNVYPAKESKYETINSSFPKEKYTELMGAMKDAAPVVITEEETKNLKKDQPAICIYIASDSSDAETEVYWIKVTKPKALKSVLMSMYDNVK
ncbi:hypothetical protein [Butyrivibrio proteoclasticus]|uniref:hypothetical protein n=1 Tax=Butyrivibrio proteoclasticus TaxID=43305 RepID=UPI00047AB154|nr:hypothetical protein [Butyrivibrio proteoclasticus]